MYYHFYCYIIYIKNRIVLGGSLSPSNQFDADKFSYDPTYTEKVTRETQDFSHSTNKIEVNPSFSETVEKLNGCKNEEFESSSRKTSEFQNTVTDFEEDNNIEDLNLKLDSLQIDFQNGKETVEDNLNANFDNFGTFFGSSTLNDSPETSYYLPKIDDIQNCETFEKEPKSQETLSDTSVSIPNEDSSDIDVALEIPHDSIQAPLEIPHDSIQVPLETPLDSIQAPLEIPLNSIQAPTEIPLDSNQAPLEVPHNSIQITLDTSSCISNVLTLEKEPISTIDCSFSQFNSVFSDVTVDNIDDNPNDNVCSKCIDECTCSDNVEKDENVTNAFVVDWNENKYDEFTTIGNKSIQDVSDFPLTSGNDLKDIINGDSNAEIDSGLDLFTSFDKKDDGNDDLDDFDDFATFHSSEVTDINSSNVLQQTLDIEIKEEKFGDLEKSLDDKNEIIESHLDDDNSGQNVQVSPSDDNDDFGDFDAYNPTDKVVVKSNSENDFAVDEFLFDNDSTATEKLNLAIKSIFSENAGSECDSEFSESSLELNTTLGESWNHLINYEAEQSYLFAWNNSASQKSLLKSLGIDSRNIVSIKIYFFLKSTIRYNLNLFNI